MKRLVIYIAFLFLTVQNTAMSMEYSAEGYVTFLYVYDGGECKLIMTFDDNDKLPLDWTCNEQYGGLMFSQLVQGMVSNNRVSVGHEDGKLLGIKLIRPYSRF